MILFFNVSSFNLVLSAHFQINITPSEYDMTRNILKFVKDSTVIDSTFIKLYEWLSNSEEHETWK